MCLVCVLLLRRMASEESAHFPLLALPDACLLAVLQCCASEDQRSLLSAARAHSRLHHAAVAALRNIKLFIPQHQVSDRRASVMLYLRKHGKHIDMLTLNADAESPALLREMPPVVQLSSLYLWGFRLQLQPGQGYRGMLGAAATVAALKHMELRDCKLLDDIEGLAASLLQLTGLERLTIYSPRRDSVFRENEPMRFPTFVLEQLQQLTRLGLVGTACDTLQPMHALSRLLVLHIDMVCAPPGEHASVSASMLSQAVDLTALELRGCDIEPAVLAGKQQLQHLHLANCTPPGDAVWVLQLLSHLQPLMQLTYLNLTRSLWDVEGDNPPATAYSAITASSKLQHLDITECLLPPGVWQHMFPMGRQLPHLQNLNLSEVEQADGGYAIAPEGNRLVSCCPGLQELTMTGLQGSVGQLGALQHMSGLHSLILGVDDDVQTTTEVQPVLQLSGLTFLLLNVAGSNNIYNSPGTGDGILLQLTRLKQLAHLIYTGPFNGYIEQVELRSEVGRALSCFFSHINCCHC
jgi:hypothetical protein